MPRPAASPRLQAIDPSLFAREFAVQAARDAGLPRPKQPGVTKIARKVRTLAWFAVHGGPIDDERRRELWGLVSHLSPTRPGHADWWNLSDLSTGLGVLLLAARARLRLAEARPRPVTGAEFSALAGLDASHVRRLLREGVLAEAAASRDEREIDSYPRAAKLIRPDSARAFLDAAGVTTAPEGAPTETKGAGE